MPTTMLVTMMLCFALTISVAVSIGLASLVGAWQANLNFLAVVKEMFSAINKFPLAAIPFFILAGNLMESGGISQRLVEFAKSLVGGIQGGLAATCVLTCMIFAAVSGSSVATTFAIGAILIPALIKHGYPTTYAAALQATSAELGVIIPPSIPMILYGVSAEVSIGELFIAGFGPGLLIGGALMLFVVVYARLKGYGKDDREGRLPFLAGHAAGRAGAADAGDHPRRHLRRRLHADRGLGRRGVLRAGRRRRHLSRDRRSRDLPQRPAQERDLVGGDHVHHRQRRAVQLPDHARRRAGRRSARSWSNGCSRRRCSCSASTPRCSSSACSSRRRASIIVLAPILAPVADALRHRPGAFRHHHGREPGARHDHAAVRRQPVRRLHGRAHLARPDRHATGAVRAGRARPA